MFGKLLSEQEINRVKDKFAEDTDNSLEEAIRKHVSIIFYLPINFSRRLAKCLQWKCSNMDVRSFCLFLL